MKALVVDDDPAARYLLKRILMREFNYTVVEAEDGLEALKLLEQQNFSVMLLDVRMPIMDGIETLQQIRKSPKHASLSIVMTTAQKEETIVRQAVALGITDYLVKTSNAYSIVERLNRALKRRPVGDDRGLRGKNDNQADVSLTADSLVMIVDGDSDFRHFLLNLFQGKHRLCEAKSAAQALGMCHESVPALVFVGVDVGMMSGECFVRKAREGGRMSRTTFVAVVPKNRVEEVTHTGLYDAVAARSFVPEAFLRQLGRFFAPQTPLKRFLDAHPSFRLSMLSSTEQVFGMVLAEEISVCATPPSDPGERTGVLLPLEVPGDGVTLTLVLSASTATARIITARMVGGDPNEITEEDAPSGLFELANMIGGRLQHSLNESGSVAHIGLPAAAPTPTANERAGSADEIRLTFAFELGHPTFTLSLSVASQVAGSKP